MTLSVGYIVRVSTTDCVEKSDNFVSSCFDQLNQFGIVVYMKVIDFTASRKATTATDQYPTIFRYVLLRLRVQNRRENGISRLISKTA